jgi:hypothetical protein
MSKFCSFMFCLDCLNEAFSLKKMFTFCYYFFFVIMKKKGTLNENNLWGVCFLFDLVIFCYFLKYIDFFFVFVFGFFERKELE